MFIYPFLVKSGLFYANPDQFLEKGPDPDQSPEKTDHMGALPIIQGLSQDFGFPIFGALKI